MSPHMVATHTKYRGKLIRLCEILIHQGIS